MLLFKTMAVELHCIYFWMRCGSDLLVDSRCNESFFVTTFEVLREGSMHHYHCSFTDKLLRRLISDLFWHLAQQDNKVVERHLANLQKAHADPFDLAQYLREH